MHHKNNTYAMTIGRGEPTRLRTNTLLQRNYLRVNVLLVAAAYQFSPNWASYFCALRWRFWCRWRCGSGGSPSASCPGSAAARRRAQGAPSASAGSCSATGSVPWRMSARHHTLVGQVLKIRLEGCRSTQLKLPPQLEFNEYLLVALHWR